MFSGLEAQSEVSRLLDELYGKLDRVSPAKWQDVNAVLHYGLQSTSRKCKGERKR